MGEARSLVEGATEMKWDALVRHRERSTGPSGQEVLYDRLLLNKENINVANRLNTLSHYTKNIPERLRFEYQILVKASFLWGTQGRGKSSNVL